MCLMYGRYPVNNYHSYHIQPYHIWKKQNPQKSSWFPWVTLVVCRNLNPRLSGTKTPPYCLQTLNFVNCSWIECYKVQSAENTLDFEINLTRQQSLSCLNNCYMTEPRQVVFKFIKKMIFCHLAWDYLCIFLACSLKAYLK